MKQYLTYSEKETHNLGKVMAKKRQGNIIALFGDLGAGKTTFVQGFAKGLGIKDKIISPTFVLIRQHKLKKGFLYHIDLYRLEDNLSIKELGIDEIISNPNNLVLIEWAEKMEKNLPKNAIKINLKKLEGDKRLITIS